MFYNIYFMDSSMYVLLSFVVEKTRFLVENTEQNMKKEKKTISREK